MAGSIWLPKEEADFYRLLLTFTGVSNPLKVIWYALQTELDRSTFKEPVWVVPSLSNSPKEYQLPEDASTCTCDGFFARHKCIHIAAAKFRSRMEFGMR